MRHRMCHMRHPSPLIVAFVMLSTPPAATFANASAKLQITGTISIRACRLQINDELQSSQISRRSLGQRHPSILAQQVLNFQIRCPQATRFALSIKDNHAVSRVHNLWAGSIPANFGLALSHGYQVGAMAVQVTDSHGDNTPLLEILQYGQQWRWQLGVLTPGTLLAWQRVNWQAPNAPQAFQAITAKLRITPIVRPARYLPRHDEIRISGHITGELHYL